MASTRWTPDLLKEVGFDFLMDWPADDQPLWMKTRSGPLMSVPYPIEINDSPQVLVRHHTPEQFRDFIIGQFEELLRQSAKQPLVCGIALHTMIVGQPYRLRMLREALQHIANHPQKDKVWFTRPSDIYDHCAALAQGHDGAAAGLGLVGADDDAQPFEEFRLLALADHQPGVAGSTARFSPEIVVPRRSARVRLARSHSTLSSEQSRRIASVRLTSKRAVSRNLQV